MKKQIKVHQEQIRFGFAFLLDTEIRKQKLKLIFHEF